jgi:hypothetical protein
VCKKKFLFTRFFISYNRRLLKAFRHSNLQNFKWKKEEYFDKIPVSFQIINLLAITSGCFLKQRKNISYSCFDDSPLQGTKSFQDKNLTFDATKNFPTGIAFRGGR